MFKNIPQLVNFANIFVMTMLIILVMLQNRSQGLSTVFGGTGGVVSTRRGVDKWMFYATIVLGIAFASLSVANILLRVK